MRHLGSLALSLFLGMIIWLLLGYGLGEVPLSVRTFSWEIVFGLLALLAAGLLYSLLLLPRLSPVGPVSLSLGYLGLALWSMLDGASYIRATLRVAELLNVDRPFLIWTPLLVMAVPLFGTALSPRRWRQHAEPRQYAGVYGMTGPFVGTPASASYSGRHHGSGPALAPAGLAETRQFTPPAYPPVPGSTAPYAYPTPQTPHLSAPPAPHHATMPYPTVPQAPPPAAPPQAVPTAPGPAHTGTDTTTVLPGPAIETTTSPDAPPTETTTVLPAPSTEATTQLSPPSGEPTTVLSTPSGEPTTVLSTPSGEPTTVLRGPTTPAGQSPAERTEQDEATAILESAPGADSDTTVVTAPETAPAGPAGAGPAGAGPADDGDPAPEDPTEPLADTSPQFIDGRPRSNEEPADQPGAHASAERGRG